MEQTEYEEQQTELQQHTRAWLLERGSFNSFVTLTSKTRDGIGYEDARKLAGSFFHGLKTHLFGAKSKKRINAVPIVEGFWREPKLARRLGIRQGTHIHCLMNLPDNPLDHRDVVRELWMESGSACGDPHVYCPNSNKWFLNISDPVKQRIYTNYALKTCRLNTDAVLWKFVPVRPST